MTSFMWSFGLDAAVSIYCDVSCDVKTEWCHMVISDRKEGCSHLRHPVVLFDLVSFLGLPLFLSPLSSHLLFSRACPSLSSLISLTHIFLHLHCLLFLDNLSMLGKVIMSSASSLLHNYFFIYLAPLGEVLFIVLFFYVNSCGFLGDMLFCCESDRIILCL